MSWRGSFPDLTPGNTYRVIGISENHIRVLSDEGRPYLFPVAAFWIVDSAIPEEWRVEVGVDGTYKGPQEFSRPGFWDDFFDDSKTAVTTFRSYMAKVVGRSNAK